MKIKIILLFMFLWFSSEKAVAEDPDPNSPQNFKHYIVSFLPNADKSIVKNYGTIDYEFKTIKAVTAILTPEAATQLAKESGIKNVEEDQEIDIGPATTTAGAGIKALNNQMRAMDYNSGSQWNLGENGINAENAWANYNVDGSGVKIAIIDSGVNYSLPDLAEGYLGGYNYCVTGTGTSCSGEDDNPMDAYGHGTQMATAMLAKGTTLQGVAPQVQYYALKITNNDSRSSTSILLKALDWVAAQRVANIIYLGIHQYHNQLVADFIINNYDQNNILFIAPSYAITNQSYPAAYEHAIGVGAHTKDLPQQITPDTGNYADVVAPGEAVPVLDLNGNVVTANDSVGVAAAQVAGALALMIDYSRQHSLDYNNAKLWRTLDYSALDLWPGNALAGWGKADVNNALTLMANDWFLDCNAVFTEPNYIDSNIPGYFTGSRLQYKITITNNIPPDFTGHKDINHLIITASLRYDGSNSNPPFSIHLFDINLPRGQTENLLGSYIIDSNALEGKIVLDVNIAVEQSQDVIKKVTGAAYAVVSYPCGSRPDFVLDKIVNFQDFARLASWWLSTCDAGNNYCYGTDLVSDGVIDLKDLQLWISYWLCRYP